MFTVDYANHQWATHVVQEFIKNYGDKLDINSLINQHNRLKLSCRKSGNHVIQTIFEQDVWYSHLPTFLQFKRDFLVVAFREPAVLKLSLDKFGSYVVQKCIKTSSSTERNMIKNAVCRDKCIVLKKLLKDEYGNFVLDTLFSCCNSIQKEYITKWVKKKVVFNTFPETNNFLRSCKAFQRNQR